MDSLRGKTGPQAGVTDQDATNLCFQFYCIPGSSSLDAVATAAEYEPSHSTHLNKPT